MLIFYIFLAFVKFQHYGVLTHGDINYKVIYKDFIKILTHLPLQNEIPPDVEIPPMPPINNNTARTSKSFKNNYFKTDVEYYIYESCTKRIRLELNTHMLNNTNPTKIFVHGWLEDSNTEWYNNLVAAYFKRGSYNIIAVDWFYISVEPYVSTVWKVQAVGDKIGNFLSKIFKSNSHMSSKNFHIIGHSIGAHVAGFIGKQFFKMTSKKIGRITALDAAGPLFDMPVISEHQKLSSQDALFVDAVHTDGGLFGFNSQLGKADFYANGGVGLQPGCNISNLFSSFFEFMSIFTCSHSLSHKIFLESVNSNQIIAQKCDSMDNINIGLCKNYENVIFGEDAPWNINGNYHFYTNAAPPYAKFNLNLIKQVTNMTFKHETKNINKAYEEYNVTNYNDLITLGTFENESILNNTRSIITEMITIENATQQKQRRNSKFLGQNLTEIKPV